MKRIKITTFIALLILIGITKSVAQVATPPHLYANNTNAWFMYFGDHKLSDKWGIHLEAQARRADLVANWQQLLLRTGVNYYLSSQIFATAGYCFVQTHPYGGFPVNATFPEHRLWEQLQIKQQLEQFEWVTRFRLEQRFSNLPVLNPTDNTFAPGDAVYTNRFRLLNRFSLPFKGKTIVDKSLYISAYDEFFINFGEKIATNFLDQNRAYVALGYKIPNVGKLEVGYMMQNIFRGDGVKIENNSTLQIGLISTIDFYNKAVINP